MSTENQITLKSQDKQVNINYPFLSANKENILQYLAFFLVLLGLLRMRPSRGKRAPANWFGGLKLRGF